MENTEFKNILSPAQKQKMAAIYGEYATFKKELNLVFQPSTSRPDSNAIFFDDIFELAENVDIRVPIKVTSHRRFLGPVIKGIKKFMMAVSKPIISVCFKRQLIVNDHVLNLAQKLAVMDQRLKALEEKLDHHRHA